MIYIQSDDVEKAIVIATFDEATVLMVKRKGSRSRNVTVKKLRTKPQKCKESPVERGSALRLCAFAREIFALI
jgi:hypothetical protein